MNINYRSAGWIIAREFDGDPDWENAHVRAKQIIQESEMAGTLVKFTVGGSGKFIAFLGYIPPELDILDKMYRSLEGGTRANLSLEVVSELYDIHDGSITIVAESPFRVGREHLQ